MDVYALSDLATETFTAWFHFSWARGLFCELQAIQAILVAVVNVII